MPRVRLTIEYDGTDFVGWQRQPNGRSVQEVVEKGLAELLGQAVPTAAAGRTDAGVHALGQVVALDAPRSLPSKAYVRGLSALLPGDVAVVEAEEVPDDFDPRRWATGKRYRYLISRRPVRPEVRVERVGRFIHHYGHGGAGYTLARGSAEEVVSLVDR